jgi:ribonuclease HI
MLATYRATSGQRTSLRSSLWRRDGGTWQLVFHQGTLAAR